MSYSVIFSDKAGKLQRVTFGTLPIAQNYSKTVKGRVEESSILAPVIAVCRVQDGTAQAQKEATERFYLGDRAALPVDSEADESASEAMAEHFAEARTVGMCAEDAWADWDSVQTQSGRV